MISMEFYLFLVLVLGHIVPLALAIAIIVGYLFDKHRKS